VSGVYDCNQTIIENAIETELTAIERDEGVRILFAVESGSRAWGFPSADSDYDVRFVYARPAEGYLSVFEDRDVIERPITGLLDVNGWDLKKALALLRKSNPALMEWVVSPMIYRESSAAPVFRKLAKKAFRPLAACHHYLSMARTNQRRANGEERVRLKVYLYALRPLLAAKWVITYGTLAPMRFAELVEAFLPSGPVRSAIDELVRTKSSTGEQDSVEHIADVDEYIAASIIEVDSALPPADSALRAHTCNTAFRELLGRIWADS